MDKDIHLLALKRELLRRKATSDLIDFTYYTNYSYEANWHHYLIASELTKLLFSETEQNLMLFVPPQHGKSELSSRAFPSFALGVNPDLKIAACSYSIDLSKAFNRDVQRIIESDEYNEIFPDTKLNGKRVVVGSGAYVKNTTEFEVVNHKGSYKAVGVMGGLSGRTVDLAIIDDPIKDSLEANSETYRNRTWEWYLSVLRTRLHNKSKQVLIMTRWHEDDLAGRILEREPDKWKVVKIPAIKTHERTHYLDNREFNEPLWASKHSFEKLDSLRKLSAKNFASLYQQEPRPIDGDVIKNEWINIVKSVEVPTLLTVDCWIDGAYTKNTKNDPTGLMYTMFDKSNKHLYISFCKEAYLEMPKLLREIDLQASIQNTKNRTRYFIEPKASGKTLKQLLSNKNYNAIEIKTPLIMEGKMARAEYQAIYFESSKISFIEGTWNDKVIDQITAFPSAKHDEFIDLLGYACEYYFGQPSFKMRSTSM